jgi:hypothetical protein
MTVVVVVVVAAALVAVVAAALVAMKMDLQITLSKRSKIVSKNQE